MDRGRTFVGPAPIHAQETGNMQQPAVQPRANKLPPKNVTLPGEVYWALKYEAELYEMSTLGFVKLMIQRGREVSKDETRTKMDEALKRAAEARTGA